VIGMNLKKWFRN